MTERPVIWLTGVAGSLLAHAVGLVGIIWTLQPQPVPEQPLPESELEVQSHRLERGSAREAAPRPEPARKADGAVAQVPSGAIRRTEARPTEAQVLEVSGARPDADRLNAAAARGDRARRAAPDAQTARAEAPDVAALEARRASPTRAQPARPQPATMNQLMPDTVPALARRPEPVVLAAAFAPATAQIPLRPDPVPTAAVNPDMHVAPDVPAAPELVPGAAPATLPAAEFRPAAAPATAAQPAFQPMKATLAFPDAGSGPVDPVSLAAFQSFVRPGDAASGSDTLRDGVSTLLAQMPCSRLQVSFDPDSATLQVNGHVPEGDLRAPVLTTLRQQMGADIGLSDQIMILPRPTCSAIGGMAGVGLPQSTDQITNPLLIGEDAHARVLDFVKGDRLFFDITAPDYDAWIYVDYFDAGGNVLHLTPNEAAPLAGATAKSALRIGARNPGDPGLQIFIGPPYGHEIAVAFATSRPLYDGLRPLQEPAAPYLQWLRDRVAEARGSDPGFKGEWVYFFVTTAEN